MQRLVARHHGYDAIDVVGIDGLLELPDLLQGVEGALSFRPLANPQRRAILNCASAVDAAAPASSRSLAWSFKWRRLGRSGGGRDASGCSIDLATSFHRNARCPHIGLKECGKDVTLTGGLLPFPRTGCVLYATATLTQCHGLRSRILRLADAARRFPAGLAASRPVADL